MKKLYSFLKNHFSVAMILVSLSFFTFSCERSVLEPKTQSEWSLSNNGIDFKSLKSSYSNSLNSCYFVNENIGWAVGDVKKYWFDWNTWDSGESLEYFIYYTSNGGKNWYLQYYSAKEMFAGYSSWAGLLSVFFIDQYTGWVAGDEIVLRTINQGIGWSKINTGPVNGYSIFFLDVNTGWLAGSHFPSTIPPVPIIQKSIDGGENWEKYNKFDTNLDVGFHSIQFVNENVGWAVGVKEIFECSEDFCGIRDWPVIYKTIDGGEVWYELERFEPCESFSSGWQDICFIDEYTGWAVGPGIVKTIDGGENWVIQSGRGGNSVFFINENLGWVVGDDGVIIKTINGGRNWIVRESGTNSNLYDVHFIDENTGWIVGDGGIILKTTTGG